MGTHFLVPTVSVITEFDCINNATKYYALSIGLQKY